jgi:hypothetical protein
MPEDLSFALGMHVRKLPNFYITKLLPQNYWTGIIVEVMRSSMGQPGKYLVHLDHNLEGEDRDFDVSEAEMEQSQLPT